MQESFNGILLVDKPKGWSSFKAVAVVRRRLSEVVGKKVKVGHAGTLDPFATGLLILLVGTACKEAGRFLKLDKTYEVTAVLGKTSSTGDPEGELTALSDRQPTEEEVQNALKKFTGEIQQVPPMYSAIKVNGVRAYKLARKGAEVTIKPRTVTIYRAELREYDYPCVRFVCDVSSGTYIRSLVQDVGEELKTGAYTSELRRLSIAQHTIQTALRIDEETASEEIITNIQD